MATFNAQRLAIQRKYDQRLTDDMGKLAKSISDVAGRFAAGSLPSERVIPNTKKDRDRVKKAVYNEVILPYFVGPTRQPFSKAVRTVPQSPFARLVFDGIREMIVLEVQRQTSLLRKAINDDVVWGYLTVRDRTVAETSRPNFYDPFHLFVYHHSTGQPYRLSDAIWDTSIDARQQLDALFDYWIPRGLAAVDYEPLIYQFMTASAAKVKTQTPYGTSGSYSARRLARTEITAAGGRAYLNAAQVNPYIDATKWTLSASHPKFDVCDGYASGGPEGNGVYPNQSVPPYPAHPHCLCSLIPQVTKSPAAVTAEIRAYIDAGQAKTKLPDNVAASIRNQVAYSYLLKGTLKGVFNEDWLVDGLLYGGFIARML